MNNRQKYSRRRSLKPHTYTDTPADVGAAEPAAADADSYTGMGCVIPWVVTVAIVVHRRGDTARDACDHSQYADQPHHDVLPIMHCTLVTEHYSVRDGTTGT